MEVETIVTFGGDYTVGANIFSDQNYFKSNIFLGPIFLGTKIFWEQNKFF